MDIEKIIREYLPQVIHMSLATSRDDTPWVTEVHFAYDENLNLYFRSLPSRRHSQEIANNPKVAGNIIKQHRLEDALEGVYFEGTARKLDAGAEQDVAAKCIMARLGEGDDIIPEASRPDGHQFYGVTVSNWYVFGRYDGDYGKHKLEWNGGK